MDRVSPETRSRMMRAVKSKWTSQEVLFGSLFTGWEQGTKDEFHADFVFRKDRLAVFLDGDFWHGREIPDHLPAAWKEKLARTAERDARNREKLELKGWHTLSFWESEFLEDPSHVIQTVHEYLTEWAHPC